MSVRVAWRALVLVPSSIVLLAGIARAQAQPPAEAPPPAEPAPSETTTPSAIPPPVAAQPTPVPPLVPVVDTPLKIVGRSSSIRLGILAQPQFESIGSSTLNDNTYNLFLRRVRILVGGTIFGDIEYFVDTDYPNLFKNTVMGQKNTPGLNVQDAFVTYKAWGDMIKIDAGYMLPPLSHNAVQGATTLYAWDYMFYTFTHSNVFGSTADPIGRDLGLQVRGLLIDGHLEYRAGLFQGFRDVATMADASGRNFFRFAARLQVNLLDAEPGFFYAGTYLGAKRIASIGGSYDFQNDYKHWDIDGFLDLPLGPGLVTAQVDYNWWNGNGFVNLPKQSALTGEAGFLFAPFRVSPIIRGEHRWTTNVETRLGGGVAYWMYGHNSNLKLFYMRVSPDGADGFNQFVLQWQVYYF